MQDTQRRLTALELQLSAGATVSESQAAERALAVKNVGQRLVATGDKAGYPKVSGELHPRGPAAPVYNPIGRIWLTSHGQPAPS